AVSCFRSKLRECIIAPSEPPQAPSLLPTTKRRYASRMSLSAWDGQPGGYQKCPVAYNTAAHAEPLSERIVSHPEAIQIATWGSVPTSGLTRHPKTSHELSKFQACKIRSLT